MYERKLAVLEQGTTVYLSQTGHKNFNYPSKQFAVLAEDTPAERLAWTGGAGKIPYAIPAQSVFPAWKQSSKVCVWVEEVQPVSPRPAVKD
tara:strand:- start:364 stop:636 length:273 start_codon:yes stop_codon:yes gene_type:complete